VRSHAPCGLGTVRLDTVLQAARPRRGGDPGDPPAAECRNPSYRLTIMPNTTPGRGPDNHQARPPLTGPLLLAGAIALAVLAVVLGGVLGRPADPATVAVAASRAPSVAAATPVTPGPTATEPPTESDGDDPGAATAEPAATPEPTATPETSPSASGDPAGIPAARLQARLDAMREKLGLPGVSVAIVWDDGRQWLGASGWANVKAREPMTTGTAFALASVSKTLTAAVVLQLVEERKLSLDTRVAELLPDYNLHPRMTVRQLLDHTSGLPDYFLNVKIDKPLQAEPDATWTTDRTWAYVRKRHPDPGNLWIYSNANYLLLGEVVESVTGRPIAKEIRKRLLDPLGLETTWYQAVEKPRVEGATGYRILLRAGGGVRFAAVAPASDVMPFRSVVTAAGGAGSIAATALDAARWMQAYAGGDVLTAAMRKQQLADVAVTRKLGARIPYGLGIQAVPVLGHRALGHSGRFLGFRNEVRYLPDDGIAIAVLTNQGVVDPGRVERALLKIVLPREAPSPQP
jgi:D-alanyl-D-alanine carboxypeptidase